MKTIDTIRVYFIVTLYQQEVPILKVITPNSHLISLLRSYDLYNAQNVNAFLKWMRHSNNRKCQSEDGAVVVEKSDDEVNISEYSTDNICISEVVLNYDKFIDLLKLLVREFEFFESCVKENKKYHNISLDPDYYISKNIDAMYYQPITSATGRYDLKNNRIID